MCIIIYKPEGRKLFPDVIRLSYENNSDGAGFSYVENGELHTQRGFFTLADFNAAYEPHSLKQALLHFRIKTHGNLSVDNCHPHLVSPKMVFAHNGVIYKMPHDKDKSDTLLFNELLLKNLVRIYGKKIVFDKYFKTLIADYTGSSKLVFMTNEGKVSIIRENDGIWDSDCWFSNDSFRKEPIKTKYNGSHNHYDDDDNDLFKKKKKNKHLPALPKPEDEHSPYYPNRAPYKPNPSPIWTPLQIGDYVKTVADYGSIQAHHIGKCMGFYENRTIEVYFYLTRITARIPMLYLEKINLRDARPIYRVDE